MRQRAILLNGPPQSGKDTAGSAILATTYDTTRMKFSDPVKRGTHASYGMDPDVSFEEVKDQPRPEFLYLTPRNAYITHSESYMKQIHGSNVFGRIFANRLRQEIRNVVVPDSGFVDEAIPVLDYLNPENVLVVNISRSGCNFDNDSRSYISLPGTIHVSVQNNERDAFENEVIALAQEFLQQ